MGMRHGQRQLLEFAWNKIEVEGGEEHLDTCSKTGGHIFAQRR